MGKISIKPLDALASKVVRYRDLWQCQKCLKSYTPPTRALHCCHIFTRGNKSTRFFLDNLTTLCYGCHSYLDANPLKKYEWYKMKYGETKFNFLRVKTNMPKKLDKELIRLFLTQELEKNKKIWEERR